MYLSRKWLSEFLKIDVSSQELADKMSISGLEVEGYEKIISVQGLKTGKVISLEKHPEADKLNVCQVDIGTETLQIVCGAANVHEGAYVIVAPVGTVLPEIEIKSAKLRGIDSNGMLCALQELGLDEKFVAEAFKAGIYLFGEAVELGVDPIALLGFDDEVLDISITPNRADALSMFGLAYEVGAIYSQIPKFPTVSEKTQGNWFNITLDTEQAPVYYAGKATNITVKSSPSWMQSYLIANNVRPINNVVDITNFVMLETGQPLHAFDFDTLQGDIVVREARKGEKLVTLDEKERELDGSDIVITDSRGPIALAGVMGGHETEVTEQTTALLIESAYFKDVAIRKTANKFNLRSESSLRFEKIADPGMTQYALQRALDLLEKYADATVEKTFVKAGEISEAPQTVVVTRDFLMKKIGVNLTVEEIGDILKRLQLAVTVDGETFTVLVPTRRQEMTRKEDIAEEIARLYGFENIQGILPHLSSQVGEVTPLQRLKQEAKKSLGASGFQEFVSYSLIDEKAKDVVMIPKLANQAGYSLMSPLSEDRAYFRKSAISSLLEVVNYNVSRRQLDVFGYEISQLHSHTGNEDVVEVETVLSIIGSGKMTQKTALSEARNVSYYDIQSEVIKFLRMMNVTDMHFEATESSVLQPGISAEIIVGGMCVGTIGKIDPRFALQYEVKQAVYSAEISLTELVSIVGNVSLVQYVPVTKYPEVERDVTFTIQRDVPAQSVVDVMKDAAGDAPMVAVNIFDIYQGERMAENEKSISLRMKFSDTKETMTAEAVESIVEKIICAVEEKFNTVFRR